MRHEVGERRFMRLLFSEETISQRGATHPIGPLYSTVFGVTTSYDESELGQLTNRWGGGGMHEDKRNKMR
jgi:hypothetical protein